MSTLKPTCCWVGWTNTVVWMLVGAAIAGSWVELEGCAEAPEFMTTAKMWLVTQKDHTSYRASYFQLNALFLPSWLSACVVGMTVAVGVGIGTVGVTIGLMLARGVALLPGEGLDLLPGDWVLGVGRMLAVGGSDKLELIRKPSLEKCGFELIQNSLHSQYLPPPVMGRAFQWYLSLLWRSGLFSSLKKTKKKNKHNYNISLILFSDIILSGGGAFTVL